jgi:hypothetical protein
VVAEPIVFLNFIPGLKLANHLNRCDSRRFFFFLTNIVLFSGYPKIVNIV